MSLAEIIQQKIKKEGPVSFHDFMEMALYFPGLGYYTSEGNKIGAIGDFYTSPYISSLFGQMIAKQLEEMWVIMDKPDFTIVEQGAGTGLLCLDILNHLKHNPEFYDKLHYCIIEKSEMMRQQQKKILAEKVSWHNSLQTIKEFTGCFLSNELLDNFSVHQVVMEDELMEVFVDYEKDFKEVKKPAGNQLTDYLTKFKIVLPYGYKTEINLQVIPWINDIAKYLKKGFVMTIDYGYPAAEFYSPQRKAGTIICYHQHTINETPFKNIGSQDITAHVNFSALHKWGLQNKLQLCGFTNQAYFLQGLGLTDHINKMEKAGQHQELTNAQKMLLIRSLLMDMGTKLKVLVQQKGLSSPALSGLRFAQPFE